MGQELFQREAPLLSHAVQTDDLQLGCELPDHLAADAAGHTEVLPPARYYQADKVHPPFRHGVKDGVALRADPGRIGGILHVAAGEHRPIGTLQRRPHRKVGVGHISPVQHGHGGGFQFFSGHDALLPCPQVLGVQRTSRWGRTSRSMISRAS